MPTPSCCRPIHGQVSHPPVNDEQPVEVAQVAEGHVVRLRQNPVDGQSASHAQALPQLMPPPQALSAQSAVQEPVPHRTPLLHAPTPQATLQVVEAVQSTPPLHDESAQVTSQLPGPQ